MTARDRLDRELVRRGLATSRDHAQRLIAEGRVTVGGAPASKPATQVARGDALHVVPEPAAWVSRGGHKLAGALDALGVDPAGRWCLDAGASTGGFTDVLLSRGARRVIAVDVGYGQLAWHLRGDQRVVVLDRTNVRHLDPLTLPEPPADVVVADLSFISLRLVLAPLRQAAAEAADFVLLVKPQFEVGPGRVGGGGVVRDPQAWTDALTEVIAAARRLGMGLVGAVVSELPGPAGNIEFFVHLRAGATGDPEAAVRRAVDSAQGRGDRSPGGDGEAGTVTGVTPPRAVGLVVHGGRPAALAAAEQARAELGRRDIRVAGVAGDGWDPERVEVRAPDVFGDQLDVVVVFGGDGTFLRAAYLSRDRGVPLIGVDLGRLGFLSEIDLAGLPPALERLVAGAFTIEERMTLAVDILDVDGCVVSTSWALNEASVERTEPQRLIVLEVRVGDTTFANVPADAVICATPTGSTAYAFSAGGPIVSPLVDALLLVPVAPHSLFNRTLVVDPRETLFVRQVDGHTSCVVSCDGRETVPVPNGGIVRISRGEVPVRLARLSPFDFYERTRRKFRLQ